jgi:hypothetical protein
MVVAFDFESLLCGVDHSNVDKQPSTTSGPLWSIIISSLTTTMAYPMIQFLFHNNAILIILLGVCIGNNPMCIKIGK